MSDQPKDQVIMPVEMTDKQKEYLTNLSEEFDGVLVDNFRLTNGEHLCMLVLLNLRWIERALEQAPEGQITVESLANSIYHSTVRSWKKTAARRGE